MITSLTPEQKALFPVYTRKWIEIGLSTKPADRPRAEKAIAGLYRLAKLKEPRVIWLPCPISAAMSAVCYAALIQHRFVSRDEKPAVDSAVGSAVGSAVDSAVDSAVGSAVGSSGVVRAVTDAISRAWTLRFGGQMWPGWVAWESFFREVCGLELRDGLGVAARAYADTVESASWWWPHRDFVMVCERPLHIQRDTAGRLHSEDVLAIAWPDGWGVPMWHGVKVPEDVIRHPERITPGRIDSEPNAEVRRVMLERYGLGRYVLESGASVVHEDTDALGHPRRLLRRPMGGQLPDLLMVHVKNSTLEPDGSRKDYILAVHPQLCPIPPQPRSGEAPLPLGEPQTLTCHNAVASTFYLRGEQYAPQVES